MMCLHYMIARVKEGHLNYKPHFFSPKAQTLILNTEVNMDRVSPTDLTSKESRSNIND